MRNIEKAVDEYCAALTSVISVTTTPVGILVIGVKNNKVISKQFKNRL